MDFINDDFSDRKLFTAIIKQAIYDAQENRWDAIDFLTTRRIDPYLILLDVDPSYFKKKIAQYLKSKDLQIDF